MLTLLAGEQQTLNFYKNVGPMYGAPEVRRLYAEIGEVEEEHVTQYESLMDPTASWLEQWLLHEFTECANSYTCYSTEVDARIEAICEELLSYELEHLRIAGEMVRKHENRDPEELMGTSLPEPSRFEENREYVAKVLEETADLRLVPGGTWKRAGELPQDWRSYHYQRLVNADGSPSETAVQLKIDAQGEELVRVRDEGLARRAAEEDLDRLDSDVPAPRPRARLGESRRVPANPAR